MDTGVFTACQTRVRSRGSRLRRVETRPCPITMINRWGVVGYTDSQGRCTSGGPTPRAIVTAVGPIGGLRQPCECHRASRGSGCDCGGTAVGDGDVGVHRHRGLDAVAGASSASTPTGTRWPSTGGSCARPAPATTATRSTTRATRSSTRSPPPRPPSPRSARRWAGSTAARSGSGSGSTPASPRSTRPSTSASTSTAPPAS